MLANASGAGGGVYMVSANERTRQNRKTKNAPTNQQKQREKRTGDMNSLTVNDQHSVSKKFCTHFVSSEFASCGGSLLFCVELFVSFYLFFGFYLLFEYIHARQDATRHTERQ